MLGESSITSDVVMIVPESIRFMFEYSCNRLVVVLCFVAKTRHFYSCYTVLDRIIISVCSSSLSRLFRHDA